jgi:hypothetical protein
VFPFGKRTEKQKKNNLSPTTKLCSDLTGATYTTVNFARTGLGIKKEKTELSIHYPGHRKQPLRFHLTLGWPELEKAIQVGRVSMTKKA